jgi:predicted nucleic acid-binding protein
MLILDANILIRAVLGRRVWHLLEQYSAKGIRFYAPDAAFSEAAKYLPNLLMRKHKLGIGVDSALDYLRRFVDALDRESYSLFEDEARQRLRDRDENDWPILAAALTLSCPIWTEDKDFFGTGIATWTTKHIEIFLEAQLRRLGISRL